MPDLGLIVIDYLQLLSRRRMNRSWALIVGEIVRELRDLAGELDLPIILLSQLNRGVESRENKRPMMSDLRDSGTSKNSLTWLCSCIEKTITTLTWPLRTAHKGWLRSFLQSSAKARLALYICGLLRSTPGLSMNFKGK